MKKLQGIHHTLATGLSILALGVGLPAHADEPAGVVVDNPSVSAPVTDVSPIVQLDASIPVDVPVVTTPDDTAPVIETSPEPSVVDVAPDAVTPEPPVITEEAVEKTPDFNPEIAYNMPPVGVENTPEVVVPTVDVDAANAAMTAVSAGQQMDVSGEAASGLTESLASPVAVEAKLDSSAVSGAPMIRNGHLIGN